MTPSCPEIYEGVGRAETSRMTDFMHWHCATVPVLFLPLRNARIFPCPHLPSLALSQTDRPTDPVGYTATKRRGLMHFSDHHEIRIGEKLPSPFRNAIGI